MIGGGSKWWTRRSFLERSTLAGAWLAARPRLIDGKPVSNVVSPVCRLQAQAALSPNLQKFVTLLTPGQDQFVCEKYAAELEVLLGEISSVLCKSVTDVLTLAALTSDEVAFTSFSNPLIAPLRRAGPIRTERITFSAEERHGKAAFLQSWKDYWRSLRKLETAELQIVGLQVLSETPLFIETHVRYDFAGDRGSDIREERTGEWILEWRRDPGRWKVQRWQVSEEIRASLTGPGFADVTRECLGSNASYTRQVLPGVDYWRTTLDAACGIDVYGNNGVAVGDIYGDGFDGFYVCQPAGLPNILYRNRGDGTFEDITQAAGLRLLDGTASALFADFTNSGTQDLLVVRTSGPLLFLNHGGGKFELRPDAFQFSKPPSGTFTGVAAADYDRDGLLDVYFCLYAYYQGLSQYTHPKPYYDAQNGPPNFLLRNRGDGRFEDVTEGSGMNQNNNRFTFACGWCDYNADGWPDLFVANDFGRKNFYRNNGNGTFTDIAREAGVEDYGAGMSVSWFDYDNDGRPDLYVTDMWSAAGKRVTEQNYFLPGVEESTRRAYRKHAAGNSLFKNEGGREPLLDTSNKARVAMGRWSWSADSWDFDHDGSNDLYVTSGFISGPKRQDLSSFFWRQIVARSLDTGSGSLDYELAWNAINELIRADHSWNGYERNVCFLNNCDGTFSEVSFLLGLDFTDDSRAFGLGDFDGDGRLEVILKNRSGPQLRILQNEMPSIGNSLVLRLQGRKGNRDAIGATVTIERGNVRQTRYLQAGSGFLSQHSKEIHFGVGPETEPFEATVRWPNGLTQEFKNVPVNHRIIITEGEASFNAAPFRSRRRRKKAPGPPPDRSRPGQFGTWLLEPMPALPFSLPDLEGQIRTLGQFAGKSLLLVAVASGCEASRQQLAALEKYTTQFRTKAVELIAMNMNGSTDEMRSLVRSTGIQFPVLLADQGTAGVYEILYRYLFDRRRDLETPVSFLIDKGGSVIKVYQASVDPASVLHDVLQQPRNAEQRIQRAIGSTGHYHAGPPRRNYFTYGVAFIQSEHVDAALACFQEAAARNPNYAPAYYNIGTIYLNKQMLPEARTNLERAVALDPQDADAWTNLGAIAGQQKRYDEALDNLAQAVRVNPAHLVALQNLVMLYRWQGRLDKAQQAIENAIKAQPNDPEFHFALGMLLAGQEKFEGARKELARAVELRGNDAITLNNLGVVYLRLGRQADALTSFERSRQLSPDYDRPYLNTALIYKQAGQEQKAKAILQSFAERHPENDEVKKTLHELGQ